MFLYEVLPIEWLARVFKILMEITILKYVIYYGSAFAVIAVFGSIVYFIQKKVKIKRKMRKLWENENKGFVSLSFLW
jgi:hypothetical protein